MTNEDSKPSYRLAAWEIFLLVLLFFVVAGDPPPGVNEAHYLAKAKHFWQPDWLANDLFISSRDAHTTFFATVGWLTGIFEFETTAWIGRIAGWLLLAYGLFHLSWNLFRTRYASLCVAVVWIVAVQRANLAGEWAVGGIESKVLAYGFVLLGLGQMVVGRWNSTWVLLGTGAAFHVLVGGWSVVAAMLVRIFASPNEKRTPSVDELLFLLIGGSISLFGLLPSIALNYDATPEARDFAAQLYAFERLPHHLSPASFPVASVLRHSALVLFTFAGCSLFYTRLDPRFQPRFRSIFVFAMGAILLAMIGGLIGILPAYDRALAANLLRFYWFRLTDTFVPLAAGIGIAGFLAMPAKSLRYRLVQARGLTMASVAVVAVCTGLLVSDFFNNLERLLPVGMQVTATFRSARGTTNFNREPGQVVKDWIEVCKWARTSTPEDAMFITPRHQQTFKWYAHRAEVVNWKDVPQDANSLVEWAERINRIFPREHRRHPPLEVDALQEIAADFNVSYLIVDRRIVNTPLPLKLVYPQQGADALTFFVYALPAE